MGMREVKEKENEERKDNRNGNNIQAQASSIQSWDMITDNLNEFKGEVVATHTYTYKYAATHTHTHTNM